MDYQYKKQQKSNLFKLNADGTVSGAFSGSWELDANKRILSIGNQKLIVRDGYNWESKPRKATLVLSGLTSQGRPWWGKKIN